MPLNNVVRTTDKYVSTDEVAVLRESALNLVQHLLAAEGIADPHRKELLSIALWKWTEAAGIPPYAKYNLRFVSEGVMSATDPVSINHEHVFTRKSLVQQLTGRRWTRESLARLLDEQGVACTVTVDEHAQLGQSRKSGWARYADAGVRVFDRAIGAYVDPTAGFTTARVPTAAPAPTDLGEDAVLLAIRDRAKPSTLAPLLERLTATARVSEAIAALQRTQSAPKYFRLHDARVEEPTRAVAFANYNGNLDFALDPDEVPSVYAEHDSVTLRPSVRKPYRVRCRLRSTDDLRVAEELLAMALEKLRSEHLDYF